MRRQTTGDGYRTAHHLGFDRTKTENLTAAAFPKPGSHSDSAKEEYICGIESAKREIKAFRVTPNRAVLNKVRHPIGFL
eukprot:IDg6622t1